MKIMKIQPGDSKQIQPRNSKQLHGPRTKRIRARTRVLKSSCFFRLECFTTFRTKVWVNTPWNINNWSKVCVNTPIVVIRWAKLWVNTPLHSDALYQSQSLSKYPDRCKRCHQHFMKYSIKSTSSNVFVVLWVTTQYMRFVEARWHTNKKYCPQSRACAFFSASHSTATLQCTEFTWQRVSTFFVSFVGMFG